MFIFFFVQVTKLMLLELRFKRYVSFMSIKINWPCLLTHLPPWLGGGVLSDLTIKGGEGGLPPSPPLKRDKLCSSFCLQSKCLDVVWARTPTILFRIT